ncbi:hypothetical protein HYO25_01755 [Vibrio parahaemolyticus]|nr:hypothetical protein [Vibrio parahaemolyticus]
MVKSISEPELKHLEFTQGVVTRMNTNSFQIKNWSITLFTALVALYGSNSNDLFLFIATFPSVLFWLLDAYYLQQERKFRGIYNDIAGLSKEPKITKVFEMDSSLYTGWKYSFLASFLSVTMLKLYPILIFLSLGSHFLVSGDILPEELVSSFDSFKAQGS